MDIVCLMLLFLLLSLFMRRLHEMRKRAGILVITSFQTGQTNTTGVKHFSHGRTDCRSAKTKDVLFELIESTFPVFPHLFDCLGHAYLSAYNEKIYLTSNTTTKKIIILRIIRFIWALLYNYNSIS